MQLKRDFNTLFASAKAKELMEFYKAEATRKEACRKCAHGHLKPASLRRFSRVPQITFWEQEPDVLHDLTYPTPGSTKAPPKCFASTAFEHVLFKGPQKGTLLGKSPVIAFRDFVKEWMPGYWDIWGKLHKSLQELIISHKGCLDLAFTEALFLYSKVQDKKTFMPGLWQWPPPDNAWRIKAYTDAGMPVDFLSPPGEATGSSSSSVSTGATSSGSVPSSSGVGVSPPSAAESSPHPAMASASHAAAPAAGSVAKVHVGTSKLSDALSLAPPASGSSAKAKALGKTKSASSGKGPAK